MDQQEDKLSEKAGLGPALEPSTTERTAQTVELIQLDHQAVRRDIGPLQIVALGFNIANSWAGVATAFSVALAAGGPVSLIYGNFVSAAMYGSAAVTLAELASVYPTAGGQYHFASIMAPKRFNRSISYACGMVATVSWIICSASVTSITSLCIASIAEFYNGHKATSWQLFLISQALNIVALGYNLFLLKRTQWVHNAAFFLTLSTFVAVSVVCLARGDKQPSSWVWTNFQPSSGWTPAVSFLTGLSTHAYMFGGLDAALHLAEETLDASKTVPKALMSTIGIGFLSGFVFSVAMTYCIPSLDIFANDPLPIYKLWRIASKSNTAGTVFLIVGIAIFTFILVATQQTTSRLLWALARDRGLVFSSHFSKLSPRLGDIPVAALMLDAGLIFLCGCISLGSTAAFNALIGAFSLMQMVSFAFPAALLLYRRRSEKVLPRKRAFRVPEMVGWACNIGTIVAAVVETVFFTFPIALPVTGSSMNYAVVVLAVIAIAMITNWIAFARKHYQGPRIQECLVK
ncbi:Amino acid transporter [Trichoderma cornu-damae]|uniref:Amino acid transporter n=1 Tax=Trichoderma cornu-damae TaxID=654480 RepID=A0A9P8QLN9_9HYPO|nr:Amino acid transporter [Trichoderma cornu-damae]